LPALVPLHRGEIPRPLRRKADAKTGRHQRDQRKGVIAGIGNVAGQIIFGKHLGKIALGIGEVLARERDDLLVAQIVDADFVESRQPAVLGDRHQIVVTRLREEAQGTDVLDRPDEAEVDLACFEIANDVAGRAALDMQLEIRILSGDLRLRSYACRNPIFLRFS
jgi:hypothetical protein